MADESKTLEFKITTPVELQGAQQAANALEQQIGKAKALKQDYSELQRQYDTIKVSIGETQIAQVAETEASTVASIATEGLTLKKRELVEALRVLNMQFPLLADAERALFEPMVAQVFVATAAVVGLAKAFSAAYEDMTGIQMPDLTSGIDDANNLAMSWDGVKNAIATANQEFSSAQSIYDRAQKGIQDQLGYIKQLIDAEKMLAIQRLENAKNAGQISEADYEARKSSIEGQSRQATEAAEEKALRAQLTQKANLASNAQAQADAAARRANSFKLPESDDAAKAQADALKKEAEAYKSDAESRRNRADEISDAAQTANQPGLAGAASIGTAGFWKDLVSRIGAIWTGNRPVFGDAEAYAQSQREKAAGERGTANAGERESARIEELIKERDKARQDAKKAAADAQKAKNDYAWENNPSNAGSLASRTQAQRHIDSVKDSTDDLSSQIDRMGNATAAGLNKISETVKSHADQLNKIGEILDNQVTTNHRLEHAANAPY